MVIADNELFPSVAWRLLLPDPAPADIVVLGDGPTARSARIELGGRPVGPSDLAGGRTADLGVAESIEGDTLTRLAAVLRPGGTAYIELDWPRGRPAGRAIDALRSHGFGPATAYSISPSADRWEASWWVPLGQPGPFGFLTTYRRPAGPSTIATVVRTALIGAIARHRSWLAGQPWLLHPRRRQRLGLVATVPGTDRAGSSAAGLAVRSLVAAGADPSSGLDVGARTVLRVGGSSTDQPMLFVFGPDRGEPSVVVKAPERGEEVAARNREVALLQRLAAGERPVPNIPVPLTLDPEPPFPTAACTFVPGRAVSELVSRSTIDGLAAAVSDWLTVLADATRREVEPGWYRALVDELVDDLAGGGGLGLDLDRARVAVAGVDPGFTVCHHRDLGPWNVHHDQRTGIGVVDWADAVPAGPPLCDLLHHLVHLTLCSVDGYDHGRRDLALADAIDPGTETGRLVDRTLAHHGGRLGLDASAVPQLRVLTWLLDLQRQEPGARAGSLYARLLARELRRLPAADRA